ncbi:MAG TPA: Asp-tRNA(Asn)/Glu-tRNA(Gln) amidotransferase GatCAB subunit C [Planctomycetaceae bacterium]|nr:Asp-tRNA(Asn)/Glu-tRNA(Gln) amidotransferase GatCAB subunit C [Planctomycetaceae bacterium]
MQLTPEDIRKVASLSKLELAPDQQELISKKLLSVLDFVAHLSQVDTIGVQEMAHPVEAHSVIRPDSLQPSLSRQEALQNAPQSDGEFFLVPPVLG